MKQGLLLICMIVMIIIAPGCQTRVAVWGQKQFYQGLPLQQYWPDIASYLCSVKVYDQITTIAMFDALLLSGPVYWAYAQNHTLRTGKSKKNKQELFESLVASNKKYISFYVLSLYENTLGKDLSLWHTFLRIGNTNYQPVDIVAIDLEPEYKEFFGTLYTPFKRSYLVRFDAYDQHDQPLISANTKYLKLYFRSVTKEVSMIWYLDEQGYCKERHVAC